MDKNNINVDLMEHLEKKKHLIDIIGGKNLTPFIVETLIEIPREIFVNFKDFGASLRDSPLPLEAGQTISQPSLVGYMIHLLNLPALENRPNVTVLEIGTASGYNAVLLAESLNKLNCPNNTVYSIELIPSLLKRAIANISYLYPLESRPGRLKNTNAPQRVAEFATQEGRLVLYKGDGTQSLGFRYDRIIVTAGGELPLTFLVDLKWQGVLVMPVGSSSQQFIVRFKKLKIPRRRLEGVESFEALNSILYQMVLENKDRRWINFKGLFSLDIDIDIPVRFVPLKKT